MMGRRAFGLMLFVLAISSSIAAQTYEFLGPNKCINCHDHEDEKTWWEKQDGPPPSGHVNSLRQMEAESSAKYARAVGLSDVYDLEGSCVGCHATVFKGDANAGISCESCHGAGSGYLEIHQEKDAYDKSLRVGLVDVKGKLDTWARQCMECHIVEDARLIAAGHPSGDDFELAAKFGVVAKHWSSRHDSPRVAAAAAPLRAAIASRRAPIEPTPAPAPVAPVEIETASTDIAPPVRPAPPRTPPPPPAPTAPVAPPSPPLPPSSPSAAVAMVQGRTLALVERLLREGAQAPVPIVLPEFERRVDGPDATLLRLQQEVLELALEVLATPIPNEEER